MVQEDDIKYAISPTKKPTKIELDEKIEENGDEDPDVSQDDMVSFLNSSQPILGNHLDSVRTPGFDSLI